MPETSNLRCAVVDPKSITRAGIRSILEEGGCEVVASVGFDSDPDDFAEASVIVVGAWDVSAPRFVQEAKLAGVTLPFVAVVASANSGAQVELIHAGFVAVFDWDQSPEVMRDILSAAARGFSMMPSDFLVWLSDRASPEVFVSAREIEWLTRLTKGSTIAELAQTVGYSERSLYRLLHDLYGRLGAANRSEAFEALRQRNLV